MSFTDVQIARVKDYWNARPCNIRHSTQPIGTKEYFDEVEARKYLVEPHIPPFADFPRWQGKKVLEIGCGIGTDTINFARHGAQVTTVDLSEKSMEVARQRAAVFGLEDRIQFRAGNAEDLSTFVPVEPYDLIYSFGVIHHTPHPGAVIAQLKHYVKPGTTVKIMVYHRRSYKVAWIFATEGRGQVWKLREIVARNAEAQTGCPSPTPTPAAKAANSSRATVSRSPKSPSTTSSPTASPTTCNTVTSANPTSPGCPNPSSAPSNAASAGTSCSPPPPDPSSFPQTCLPALAARAHRKWAL